jgi:L-amino acid N-acyltransferase YncA
MAIALPYNPKRSHAIASRHMLAHETAPLTAIRLATPDDADAIARIHVASWRETYAGILPSTFLAGLSSTDDARRWRRTILEQHQLFVYVAERPAGTIAGFAVGGPNHLRDHLYAGELQAIYLDPACERQHIGTHLVRAVATRLAERGMPSMIVWVLAANPARRFYEALGGGSAGRRQLQLGGVWLDAVAYGWPDTKALRT